MAASLEILNSSKGRRTDEQRTICEVHRQLADVLVCRMKDRQEVLQEALVLLNEAYLLGIRLVAALIDRKLAMPQWAANNVGEARKLRTERDRMVKELHEAGRRL